MAYHNGIVLFTAGVFWSLHLALLAQVGRGLACMCLPEHPQQQFCRADFVLRGKVLPRESSTDIPSMTTTEGSSPEGAFEDIMAGMETYQIHVERVFKGEDILGLLRHAIIDAARYGANCGKMLKANKVYVLSGQYLPHTEHKFQIGMCDWVAEHKTLSRKQRQGVRHLYKQYCQSCKIQDCFHGQCGQPASNACRWDPTHVMNGDIDCEGRYSRCMRKTDGSCQWYENTEMRDCMRRRESMRDNTIQ